MERPAPRQEPIPMPGPRAFRTCHDSRTIARRTSGGRGQAGMGENEENSPRKGIPPQAAAFTKRLVNTPRPVSSTSTTSPCTRSGEVPSVPIQITSPGYRVMYRVIAAM